MTKRKSLIAAFAFLLVLSFALVFGITLTRGTLTAAAEATGIKAHKTCEFCHKNFDKDDNEIEDLTLYKTYT